jgi:MinD-like ATPase involved in chromosome partitioning or flagellar assembly
MSCEKVCTPPTFTEETISHLSLADHLMIVIQASRTSLPLGALQRKITTTKLCSVLTTYLDSSRIIIMMRTMNEKRKVIYVLRGTLKVFRHAGIKKPVGFLDSPSDIIIDWDARSHSHKRIVSVRNILLAAMNICRNYASQ